MLWVDKIAQKIETTFKDQGKPLIVRDEKTASGRVHVGSMRGVAVHGVVSEALSERGVENTFLYEINDFDPMDGLPSYLDASEYEKYMGQPLYTIPSPDGKAENFAEYYGGEFRDVIAEAGFYPEFYRLHTLYKDGKFNDYIKKALENSDKIREIYKKVSGSVKSEDWYPLQVVCENCGKIGTTKVTSFDGEKVSYSCKEDLVTWAKGCGSEGGMSPFDGNAKLPWKVEWAAKWAVVGVNIEGAGKDHSTKGGSRDIASNIARDVFGIIPPFDIPYEFFLIGGKKMSSSKGNASNARDIANLLPPHMFRLALLYKDPKQQIDFDPSGDTIPLLYDLYDKIALKKWSGEDDDGAKLFEYAHMPNNRGVLEERFLPRFSIIAYLAQMPHIDLVAEATKMKGSELTEMDKSELSERAEYALHWLKEYAPENYKFELQEEVPEVATNFSDAQKEALKKVLEFIEGNEGIDGGDLHTKLHDIRKETEIEPKDYFSAIYLSILGKESGPKAGWFLSVLDRDFLLKRLSEVTK